MRDSMQEKVRSVPRWLWISLSCLYMAALLGVSSIPGDTTSAPGSGFTLEWIPLAIQNLLHIPVFGLLAGLIWGAVRHERMNPLMTAVLVFVLAATFGCLDEWHQTSVPGRYGTLTDLALDCIGALLGTAAALLINRRQIS